ncbi:MAG: CinA family protein [Chloroflexota bacterium]|nr:CinA family protein [Chloroflexota bacterium]
MSDAAPLDDPGTQTAARIGALLIQRAETVAVAETAAGGLISGALVAIPGASAWFQGGVVAYGAGAKTRWLGLPPEAFLPHGVVSEAAALALAQAVRDSVGATWGLAEVGIAGPQTGRRSRKGTGVAFLAICGRLTLTQAVRIGKDDRAVNQRAFATAALHFFADMLFRAPP